MTDPPVLIAVAHGTRAPEGPTVLAELLDTVRRRLPGIDVRVAYVDVIEPTLEDVLNGLGGPAVIVPMFLAAGYHVRVDVPNAVDAARVEAQVTGALGADPAVIAAVADRLREAGGPADAVVLAAAGSSDERALGEVRAAAGALAEAVRREVVVGYAATAVPRVADAVAGLRRRGHERIAVASYLLAPGLFQRRLADAGADVVAEPIGAHPAVAELIVERYRSG